MHYLITGRLSGNDDHRRLPHEEFVQAVQTKIGPTLTLLADEHAKVLAGGVPAGSQDLVMIVDLKGNDSHRCVRRFLVTLPVFDAYDWTVVPLETFAELAQSADH
jgi:hypothetical protein